MAGAAKAVKLNYTQPYLYPKQKAAIFDPHRVSVIEASTKSGKAQPYNSLVYTPRGPIQMGNLDVGDVVFTPMGKSEIVGIYPQGEREVFQVSFFDGALVETDADHLWEVHQYGTKPALVTTRELQSWPRYKLHRAWVPAIKPVEFGTQKIPLDPYLVGVLIGDGSLSSETVTLSNKDEEIINSVGELIPEGHSLHFIKNSNCDWHITAGRGAAALRERKQHIRGKLARLGLVGKGSHEKFIPRCYRYNTVAVRLAIIQGILDTDGSVDKMGQPLLEQTSKRLARDVEEVIQSLGGNITTSLNEKSGYRDKEGRFVRGRLVYRQRIRYPNAVDLFRLPRKRALCKVKKKTGHRKFREIKFVRFDQTQCIELNDPRGLYLTDDFIPTHNTSGCIVWILEQAFAGKSGQNFWWIAPISRVARIAFTRAMRALDKSLYTAHLGDHTITLVNGAVVWFLGADNPDSLYGEDVYAVVIDEASRMKQSAFHAIYTTLTATKGKMRIIGNVKGRLNWFHDKARYAQQGKDPEYAYHKIISHDAVAAGILDDATIEAARRSLPESIFRELYLAEASDDQGNPFGIEAIRRCVAPLSAAKPEVWGWDLAKSHDWTVGIGLDKDGVVCRFERWQSPWEATYLRIQGLTNRVRALVDSTGVGDPIVERLQKVPGSKYEGYKFTAGSKQKLMEGLAVAIQTQTVKFPPGPIVEELEAFEYVYRGAGGSRNMNDEEFEPKGHGIHYSAPDGYDDDCVCSLALAVHHKSHVVAPLHITKDLVQKARMRVMGNQGMNISPLGRW